VPKPIVDSIGESDIISIAAEAQSPKRAADVALAYASAYVDFRRDQAVQALDQAAQKIQARIDDFQHQIDAINDQLKNPAQSSPGLVTTRDQLVSQQALFKQRRDDLQVETELKTGGAQIAGDGRPPVTKVRPTPVRYAILAGVVGLVLGVAAALVRESLDDSIKSKDDLNKLAPEVPILGMISAAKARSEGDAPSLVTVDEPSSPSAESYRALRTSLQFVGAERPPRIIQFTSANAGDGKTTTVGNLGVVMARAGKKVTLVDCDLRRARLHDLFGLTNDIGFTSLYLEQASADEAARPVPGIDGLRVVTSGRLPPNPSEILASSRTGQVFASLLSQSDVLLIDSAPVLPVADPTALSVWVEAAVLVAMTYATTRQQFSRALEILLQGEVPVVGTVLNRLRPEHDYGYTYEYYGTSESRSGRRKKASVEAAVNDWTTDEHA
jgi:non-specific protein-tyrosine kinase